MEWIGVQQQVLTPPILFFSGLSVSAIQMVTGDHELFYDLENEVRFRVEEVRFRQETNTAARSSAARMGGAGGGRGAGGGGGEPCVVLGEARVDDVCVVGVWG